MGFSDEERRVHEKERKQGEVDMNNIVERRTRPREKKSADKMVDPAPRAAKKSKKPSARTQPLVNPGHGAGHVMESMGTGDVQTGDIVLLGAEDFHPLRAVRARESAVFAATVQHLSLIHI